MSRKRSCCQNSTLMFAGRKDAPRKATRSGTRLRNSVRNHFTALTTQPSRSLFSHSVACCSVSNTLRIIPRFTATVSPNFAGSRRGTWITYANADESCAQRQSCGFLSRRIHCSRSAPCPWGFRARSGHRAIFSQPCVGQQHRAYQGRPVWHLAARILRLQPR